MSHKFFTQGQAITFIEKVFGPGRQSNGGKNISVVCPLCKSVKGRQYSKQKLVIRTDEFILHCWVCGYKDKNLYKLINKWLPQYLDEYKKSFLNAEELQTSIASSKQKHKPVSLPTGFYLLAEAYARFSSFGTYQKRYFNFAFDYLKKRGVASYEAMLYWKFGVTLKYKEGCRDRIIIPSFDDKGDIVYWTGRSWRAKPKRKYNNPPCNRTEIIFNEINIDWSEPLTIVEGPFDLIKCNENATCMLGSDLTLEYKLMQKILHNKTPIILAFDPDKKAQEKQFVLANRFLEFDIPVKILEYSNQEKDVGDLSRMEFNNLLENAKQYSADYHLRRKIRAII